MRLLVFLAKGFETIEFSAFIDVMGWAKTDFDCDIETVICGLNSKVVGSFNVSVLVDKTIEKVSADDYDALAIPGGFEEFGFYEEAYNEKLLDLTIQLSKEMDCNSLCRSLACREKWSSDWQEGNHLSPQRCA